MDWLRDLQEALFPVMCLGCGAPAGFGPLPHLCGPCASLVPSHVWPVRASVPGIRSAWYLLPYEGLGGILVRAGKYGQRESLLAVLAARVAHASLEAAIRPDMVVAVPSPWTRVAVRGFSAPGMLAAEVARARGIPHERVLARRPTPKQANLARAHRWDNVAGSVTIRNMRLSERSILLVDDVVTTGATVATCAQALLEAGVARVDLLVMASALP